MPEHRIPVAILGATGAVGQRLVRLLSDHPWFRVSELVASERSAGKTYGTAVHDLLGADSPVEAGIDDIVLAPPDATLSAPVVFSALAADVAATMEPTLARDGHFVVSNASAFRDDPKVPLVIPEINPEALSLLDDCPWGKRGGAIVTNPNCCVAGLALVLAPLESAFGMEAATVTTLQALSGAGYPGVPSLDAVGNVIPFIPGEEEKIAREPLKILGAQFPISVAVHRVPVIDGHTMTVFLKFATETSPNDVRAALESYDGKPESRNLPTAPARPIHIVPARDRPQPARDANRGAGMVVTVGPIRPDPVHDARLTLVVHNTLRGAAGAALLNAELLVATGRIT